MENSHSPEINIEFRRTTLNIVVAVLVLVIATGGGVWMLGGMNIMNGDGSGVLIKEVSAAEIYPQFVCTCCGKPLNKEEICCGIASDMIGYIDQQVATGVSEQDVVVATVKKYGLKSLASETAQESIKSVLAESAPDERPQLTIIEPLSYDFGDVSQSVGVVSTSFVVRNDGQTDLVINNMLSSCSCTSAALVVDGTEGPIFGMHNNPTNWSATLAPGEEANLNIYYDPNVHQDFRGNATREVTIFSNDPVDFEKSVKIRLNQVD